MTTTSQVQGHHVFTVVSGFGLRVIPRAPYRLVHGPGAQELDIHHTSVEGPRFARLIADGVRGYKSKIDQYTHSLADVLSVEKGPVQGAWQLETHQFRLVFPENFALHSVPGDSPSPFDLVGPEQTLIYVQAPAKMPSLTGLCGPGQKVSQTGSNWIELIYEHEGNRWWQRHELSGRLVLSAQGPEKAKSMGQEALKAILASLILSNSAT
jgi:hypothetical protein